MANDLKRETLPQMSKSVVINLGHGDLNNGFPSVTAQLWAAGHPLPEQFIGSLPAASTLVELYRNWQSIYLHLCDRKQMLFRSQEGNDDELEIDEGGITNISVFDFHQIRQTLEESINAWFKSEEFLNIDRELRSRLASDEQIRVIIEINEVLLRRLPWHCWNFFKDYPRAEMALSRPEYKRTQIQLKYPKKQVRILAILGNSFGIDLEAEAQLLKNLKDAEVAFIVKPEREEFNRQLLNPAGWDILFFAGHSQTEGETGRIYINENNTNNSITIAELETTLKDAIKAGLKLAIFNSCDGLGLALELEKLNIPTVIVMREPVPNFVAQEFFKHFLEAFAFERLPLYLAVQQARRKLEDLENDFPAASWLPVICQNPAVEPPTWLQLGGIPPCPYRGLFAFREEDAGLFFGREQFTQDLVKAVKKKPLVAVVGASGSGKSSVVFAGLVPQLRYTAIAQWKIISFRPGNNPIEALAVAITPLLQHSNEGNNRRLVELELEIALEQDNRALYKIIETFVQRNPSRRVLLIVDQFEEIYTQNSQVDCQPFLDGLINCVKLAPSFSLVLTLRADFYGYALSYRPFSDALQGAVFNLGPMSREELQKAIEEPAIKMQVELEKGLTNKLIDNVEGQPGRLPLLEFALTTLWSKIQNGVLTHQAYKQIGGIEEALANHAEAVYAQLCEADRSRAQRVFMQLVHLSERAEATRHLATREEVKEENWDLVTRLASSRLVVTNHNSFTGEETVEIVHEALIRSWGRLERWMEVDGEFRRWQEQLRSARRTWENSDKDDGGLLRGKPLADAEYWRQQRLDELNSRDINFISESSKLQDREIKKQKRRWQLTILGLTSGLTITSILAGIAWWQQQNSVMSEVQAITAYSEALLNSNQEFDALIETLKASRKLNTIRDASTFYKLPKKAATQTLLDRLLQEAVYRIKERNRLEKHEAAVNSVAFSPDGSIIASASDDRTIKLWSPDGREIQTLKGHQGEVWSISFSPDGQTIASGSWDGTVKLWTRTGQEIITFKGHLGVVYGVSFSPDGQTIASASSDGTVKLWTRTGQEIITLKGHKNLVFSVSFSPDGQTIATASADKTVKLWSRDGKEIQTWNGHKDWVFSVSFSPNGKKIATASREGNAKLWSLDGQEIKTLDKHQSSVTSVNFSPDGQRIATTSADKTIIIWNLNGEKLQTLSGHKDWVWNVSFSPNSQIIATASKDKTIKLWQVKGKEPQIFSAHNSAIYSINFSPDGKTLATASWDNTVRLWSLNGKQIAALQGHTAPVYSVSFSPDGKTLATASWDNTVKLWSLEGKELRTLTGHKNKVYNVAFSPDGKTLVTTSEDQTIKFWSLNGQELQTLKGHSDIVTHISFSPDGEIIATASWDNTVKLWTRDGQEIKTLKGHNDGILSVSFSPDGKIVASASEDRTVKLWTREGQEIKTIKGHNGGVFDVEFSPTDRTLATASSDGTVKLWSLEGKNLKTYKVYDSDVFSIRFSPDGRTIASSDNVGKVILWDLALKTDDFVLRGCNWLRDYLTTNRNVSQSDRALCN